MQAGTPHEENNGEDQKADDEDKNSSRFDQALAMFQTLRCLHDRFDACKRSI